MNGTDVIGRSALERSRPVPCPVCASVGTIVELGVCCTIARWIAMGPLWELTYCPEPPPPPLRAKKKKVKHG